MISYIYSATILWALALLIYKFVLVKDTFFKYNRMYLLLTLYLGFVLPFFKINYKEPVKYIDAKPAEQFFLQFLYYKDWILTKLSMIGKMQPYNMILLCGFVLGAMYIIIRLVKEAIQIYKTIKSTKIQNANGWKIIANSNIASPYSIADFLFVNPNQQYTNTEYDTMIAHESVHKNQMHYIDLFFINMATILFWYHPLIWLYRKYIVLNHEYLADEVITISTEMYGKFLIHQSLGIQPSLIGHNLVSSPLKNRLIMLKTPKSNPLKALKFMALVPALVVAATSICVAQNTKMVMYGNNQLIVKKGMSDTFQVARKSGGDSLIITSIDDQPTHVNNEQIIDFDYGDPHAPQLVGFKTALSKFLITKYQNQIKTLPNGDYELTIYSLVIDKNGKLSNKPNMYFGNKMRSLAEVTEKPFVRTKEIMAVFENLTKLMNRDIETSGKWTPATEQGKTAPAYYTEKTCVFKVVNGQIIFE